MPLARLSVVIHHKLNQLNRKNFSKSLFYLLLTSGLMACTQQDPAIEAVDKFIAEQSIDKSNPSWRLSLPKPEKLMFSGNKKYYWELNTSEGLMSILFYPETAPMHVSSTIYLTRLGYYDGLTFHRVITGFMAQGGDPYGNGVGGPGYRYAGEYSDDAKHYKAGILSMANAGPNTDGSQFFITFKPTPHLNGRHTVFGEVVQGMETLRAIEQLGSRSGQPSKPIVINQASIRIE